MVRLTKRCRAALATAVQNVPNRPRSRPRPRKHWLRLWACFRLRERGGGRGRLSCWLPVFRDGHRMVYQHVFHLLPGAAGPVDSTLSPCRHCPARWRRQFGLREVGVRGHDLPPECLAVHPHLDPRADGVAVAFGADEFQANPMVMQILVIA